MIMEDNGGDGECQSFNKHTYITFIGKANQDAGAVMAIYQSVLEQVNKDFPQTQFIIDKSVNTGCYHNEILFTQNAHWPRKNLNLTFLETIFNEEQFGKDKNKNKKTKMQHFIDRDNNIQISDEMYQATCQKIVLRGFTANVFDVKEKKTYNKLKQIKDISRIHHLKYNNKLQYQVWQYSGIGIGKKIEVSGEPVW